MLHNFEVDFVMPPFTLVFSESKHAAVQHDPSIPLQILAGPGSGKTKVKKLSKSSDDD